MGEDARKPLPAQPTLTKVALASGCATVFGLPFLAIGSGILWFAVRQHLLGVPPEDAPWWVVGAAGLVFGAAGLWMVATGISGTLRRRRVERRLLANPDEPWKADFDWDPRLGHDRDTAGAWAGGLLFLVLLCCFLAPFNYWALQEGWGMVAGVVLLFDLLPLLFVVSLIMAVVHRFKYGKARLVLDHFPFFLGEELAVRLVAPRALRRCQMVTVTLRLVEEAFESDHGSNRVQAYEGWKAVVRHERVRDALEDGALPIRFLLPAGADETWLGHTPPRYWELVVDGKAPGIDFSPRFIVPVYRRRRAAA